jgi:hypothetical protein
VTDHEFEIITLLYALGDAIYEKDWPKATLLQERLLMVIAPLGNQPHVDDRRTERGSHALHN